MVPRIRRLLPLVVAYAAGTLVVFTMIRTRASQSQSHRKTQLSLSAAVNVSEHGTLNVTSQGQGHTSKTIAANEQVLSYLKDEERRCLAIASDTINTSMPRCPCLSQQLLGLQPVDVIDDPDGWMGVERKVGHSVLAGGEWQPPGCRANTRLAVVIPCRDRDSHLRVMLRHLYPILQRQLAHFQIFVVEQNTPSVFNKAAMMNIGFLEALQRFPQMNCVMFHDVDHLLEDDRALMTCGPNPKHFASAMDEWNYRLIYTGAFGGVVTMQPELFTKVNGYSLQFFGWGGEDDDMGDRVRMHADVVRPPLEVSRYTTLRHKEDGSNPRNEKRHGLMQYQHERYMNKTFDGLSDMSYELNDVQLRPLYTWIHANLNISGLTTYPTHRVRQYRKFPGACRWNGNLTPGSGDVSWSTCRYMCDQEVRRPCIGFTYRQQPPQSSVAVELLVAEVGPAPRCVLMTTLCDLVKSSGSNSAVTYLKVPETAVH